MTYTYSFNYEIMQLPNTGGTLRMLSNVTSNWVIIKMLYMCLRWCLLSWHGSRLGFVTPIVGEVSWALLVMYITVSLASNVVNELVTGCNKIELGIEIPTIESRASNIPMTKGTTYVVMRFDR